MNSRRLHTLRAALGGAAIAVALAGTAIAPAHAQSHSHGHDASAPTKLSLDHGKKWATDDALRAGMSRIRTLAASNLDAAHAGKLTNAQYAELAGKVELEVAGIVANCKLEPAADAMLHLVVADIGTGVDVMAGKEPKHARDEGLLKVVTAVNDYSRHFAHPGFKRIRIDH